MDFCLFKKGFTERDLIFNVKCWICIFTSRPYHYPLLSFFLLIFNFSVFLGTLLQWNPNPFFAPEKRLALRISLCSFYSMYSRYNVSSLKCMYVCVFSMESYKWKHFTTPSHLSPSLTHLRYLAPPTPSLPPSSASCSLSLQQLQRGAALMPVGIRAVNSARLTHTHTPVPSAGTLPTYCACELACLCSGEQQGIHNLWFVSAQNTVHSV